MEIPGKKTKQKKPLKKQLCYITKSLKYKTMRNFAIIFAILFSTFFTSCIDQSPKVTNYEIQTIDSCEYIVSYWSKSRNITHKGNCKYCQVRSQKVIVDTVSIDSIQTCKIGK